MLLTVPDRSLADLLASQNLLVRTWHDAAEEVMMFIHMLRVALPTLADMFATGLIVLAAPVTCSALVLRYRRVTVTAVCQRADGSEVLAPLERAREVAGLEVRSVGVDMLSRRLRVAQ